MALTTIIGLILAFGFIIWSISTQGGLPLVIVFVDPGSIILVIGCSLSALIINYTFKEIIDAFR
jgi:flagellar motor component MotA